jgi:hypothetical protein
MKEVDSLHSIAFRKDRDLIVSLLLGRFDNRRGVLDTLPKLSSRIPPGIGLRYRARRDPRLLNPFLKSWGAVAAAEIGSLLSAIRGN